MVEAVLGLDSRLILVACILVVDAWCIILIATSEAGRRERWLWSAVVLACPIVGCLFWYVLGPKPVLVERSGDGG